MLSPKPFLFGDDMKEKPILFSAPMVRAILEGRKTQTRRCVPLDITGLMDTPRGQEDIAAGYPFYETTDGEDVSVKDLCRYGRSGDRLWVKETWRIGAWNIDGGIAVDYMADGCCRKEWLYGADEEQFEKYCIQSTEDCEKAELPVDENGFYHWKDGDYPCRKRPSIFMPRWASRIDLLIKNIRVERLQEIREEDAMAEGAESILVPPDGGSDPHVQGFRELWDSINGRPHKTLGDISWDANPWVWVVEFEMVK